MKKINLFIFSIIAFVASLFLTSNVFAYYIDENVGTWHYKSDKNHQLNQQMIYNEFRIRWSEGEDRWYDSHSKYCDNHTHYIWYTTNYYYVTKNGVDTPIYCIDKHRHANYKDAQMLVQRVLDPTDPKDAVILKIMSYPDSEYGYFAKVLAARAFVGFMSDYGDVTNEATCANLNSGIAWLADGNNNVKTATAAVLGLKDAKSVTKSSLRKINGVNSKTKTDKQVYKQWDKYDPSIKKNRKYHTYACREGIGLSVAKSKTVEKARSLLRDAILYGADVANGKVQKPKTVSNTAFKVTKDYYATVYEGEERFAEKEITGTITFKDFNNGKDEPVNIVINPNENGAEVKGIKYEYQVAGTDTWVSFDKNDDLQNVVNKSEKVTLNIRVRVRVPANKTKATLNFVIYVNYKDEGTMSGALLKNSAKPYPATQRYYIYDNNSSRTKKIAAKLEFNIFIGCDSNLPNKNDVTAYKNYVYTCCRPNNPDEFSVIEACEEATKAGKKAEIEKWCTIKAEYCDLCNTNIKVPKICTEFSEGDAEQGQSATISGPTDIKVCVMDGADEANNSYKLTKNISVDGNNNYSFATNNYCKVSCKEDYSFNLPTGKYVISGRYFELQMGVTATKTCYTDIIDYQQFEKDIAVKTNTLMNYVESGQATVLNKEFVNAYADYKKAITDIQACSLGWDNSISKYPEISFDYDEEYIEKLLGGKNLNFVPAGDQKTTQTKWFCNGDGADVDRTYNDCIGKGAKATDTVQTKTITVKKCTTKNATTYDCENVQIQIPTSKFAKVTTKFEATYSPESVFYTKYSTGVIEVNKNGQNLDTNKKYTKLDRYLDSKIPDSNKIKVAGLPVSLKDGKGVYNYNIKFENVGEFFDKDEYGRLLGSKSSTTLANDGNKFEGTYVCSYVVNCPECKVACKEDPAKGIFCSLETKEEPQCVGTCAYDKGYGELYTVQQISVTNFNPTERTLGANLNTEKGQALIQTITDKGESIYNEPEYSFTFTPAAISYLRDVNANSENGYLGEHKDYDMNCKLYSDILATKDTDAANAIRGTEKDYTICTSSVLDHLKDLNGVKANLVGRDKLQSWLQSDYCTKNNNVCLLVGNIGPAWK